jgi:phosphoribosyl-dephospho-CoA transferase
MHLSRRSKLSSTVRCPLCGQGFLIFAHSDAHSVDTLSLRVIEHALRSHHTRRDKDNVHPERTFRIPSWSGAHPYLASASLNVLLDSVV